MGIGTGSLSQFVNQGAGGNWLQVRLAGTESNRSGIGARISVTTTVGGEPRTQVREGHSHTGFRSQSSLVKHFGLGKANTVTELVVLWPSGKQPRVENVQSNQQITVTE